MRDGENQGEETQELDVEAFALEHDDKQRKPRARRYRIRIDRERFTVEEECMTTEGLLRLVGLDTCRARLFQVFRGGRDEELAPGQTTCFTAPGVEKFRTLVRDCTEGYARRREFALPTPDVEHLDGFGAPWETVVAGVTRWVVVHDVAVPAGLTPDRVSVALQVAPGYPDAQFDMAWFHPAIARADGRAIPSVSVEQFDGRGWQRWSRHRTPQSAWRPGLDGVATHLWFVRSFLEREAKR